MRGSETSDDATNATHGFIDNFSVLLPETEGCPRISCDKSFGVIESERTDQSRLKRLRITPAPRRRAVYCHRGRYIGPTLESLMYADGVIPCGAILARCRDLGKFARVVHSKVCRVDVFEFDSPTPYSDDTGHAGTYGELNSGLQQLVLVHKKYGCAQTEKCSANLCQRLVLCRPVKKDHEVTRASNRRSSLPAVSSWKTASITTGLARSGPGSAPRKSDLERGPSKCTARRSAPAASASRRASRLRDSSAGPKQRLPTMVSVTAGLVFDLFRAAAEGASRWIGRTGKPTCTAKRTQCSGLQFGPKRQIGAGRFSTGQRNEDNHAARKAVISAATYSRSEASICGSSSAVMRGRRTSTPPI
jgi:hypothetical protein